MVHHITVENVYCSSLTLVLLLKLLTRFTGLAQALCSTEEADSGGNSSATLNICPPLQAHRAGVWVLISL